MNKGPNTCMQKEILSIDSMLITVFLLSLLLKISYNIFNKNMIY